MAGASVPTGAQVLLVEDDDGIARPLAAALGSAGYEVERAVTGRQALTALQAMPDADAVILDLGLPDVDGIEVCRTIRREHGPDLPILILTARTSETDVVVGLDAGADDYVTKPFRLAELQARLRALLRRTTATGGEHVFAAQDLRLEPAPRRAFQGEEELDLTPKEFDLLQLLLRSAGAVVSRESIMRDVWDTRWVGNTKTLDMHISTLRRKLGDDPADPRYLTTVRGVGFRLETGAGA